MADDIPARVAVLEQLATTTAAALADIRTDLRELRTQMRTDLREIRTRQEADFRTLVLSHQHRGDPRVARS